MISADCQKTLEQAYDKSWGSGYRYAPSVSGLIVRTASKTMLDYGAGRCTLSRDLKLNAYHHNDVSFIDYDPAIQTIANKKTYADLVTCTNVLEYIEPELLDSVLKDIQNLAIKGVYIVVATIRDGCEDDYSSSYRWPWWKKQLEKYFEGGEYKIIGTELEFKWVRPTEDNYAA